MKRGIAIALAALLLLIALPAAHAETFDRLVVSNVPNDAERVVVYFYDGSTIDLAKESGSWVGRTTKDSAEFAGVIIIWNSQQQRTIAAGDATLVMNVDASNSTLFISVEGAVSYSTLYKGGVYFIKTDANGGGLNGAVFTLYLQKEGTPQPDVDQRIGEFTTSTIYGESGVIFVANMEPGNYYFVESSAPAGYVRSPGHFTFTIGLPTSEGPNIVEITAVNSLDRSLYLGGVHITVLGADEKGLNGAVYSLYRQEGDLPDATVDTIYGMYTSTTIDGATGVICVTGLPAGDYYFVEASLPERYATSSIYYTFQVNDATEGSVSVHYMKVYNTLNTGASAIPTWVYIAGGGVVTGLVILIVVLVRKNKKASVM